jgi:hypothetical protein
VALCGGLALYYLTHVVLGIRLVYSVRQTTAERPDWIGIGRRAPRSSYLSFCRPPWSSRALTALALVTAVCCAVVVYDVIHYREERAQIRAARP